MGPTLPISQELHAMKYRQHGEQFKEAMSRIAETLKDDDDHFYKFRDALLHQRFLPAGRVQAAVGSSRFVTPYNCFVSMTIPDSMEGIMQAAAEAAETMRLGGGIGFDFSTIRPRNDLITTLETSASGPVSFMGIFNSVCQTIASAGHRRGAMMAVLRVDHPDIEEFVRCKRNATALTAFNISVAVTDEFMECVANNRLFELRFEGKVYKRIDARALWDEIMRSTWEWAEPGVLFIDKINRDNNLWYAETISATNPCAEQPLPPYGACLLGSFNLVKYIQTNPGPNGGAYRAFDFKQFREDIPHVVRAMDNVIDRATYPLGLQEAEAKAKRRMGLGITGTANALESLGFSYGSPQYIQYQGTILRLLRDLAYLSSIRLAQEKGPFPALERDLYLRSGHSQRLTPLLQKQISKYGIRNSHLTSIAPTGTISLTADNVSSGIEPVFAYSFKRTINTPAGQIEEEVTDYGLREFGVRGKTADQCSVDDHVNVLLNASEFVDSAVSKTCNVGADVTYEEFKDIYWKAFKGGAKGCTTFRAAGSRMGILKTDEDEAAACYYDPETGQKTCDE